MFSKYHFFLHENYRELIAFKDSQANHFDIFISAYTKEDSIIKTFGAVNAINKTWIVFPEYEITANEIPQENCYLFQFKDENIKESELAQEVFSRYIEGKEDQRICIDSSGFIKPYLIFLLIYLKEKGIKEIQVLYTEPVSYKDAAHTSFSKKNSTVNVRDVVTFSNNYPPTGESDLCIVNVGYDSRLVDIVLSKISAKTKQPLIGFPSLQPIMYQENILNLLKSDGELGIDSNDELLYAPANNPFITAYVLSKFIKKHVDYSKNIKNIYLSPLATKPQAIGMALFYLFENYEYESKNITIHFTYPFSSSYSPISSEGIFRINIYSIEFELFEKLK